MTHDWHPDKRIRIVIEDDIREADAASHKLDDYIRGLVPGEFRNDERRRAHRAEVDINALIAVRRKGNELIFAPAVIKNISATGLLLELVDKGHFPAGIPDYMERFEVNFFLPGDGAPVTIECRPKRIRIDEHIAIGAEFSNTPSEPQRYPM